MVGVLRAKPGQRGRRTRVWLCSTRALGVPKPTSNHVER
jgi:hypothetical protein